jgi:hypothetical protein
MGKESFRHWQRNLVCTIGTIMKRTTNYLLILTILVMVGGCTTYSVTRTLPDGTHLEVSVKSTRNFEQPQVHYERTGKDAKFDFGAASATNSWESIVGGVLQGFMTGAIVPAQTQPITEE